MGKLSWISPFMRQCFVTTGVSLNMAQNGFVVGFAAVLVPQLRRSDSTIHIDDDSGSWIASLPGFTLIIGNFIMPTIMSRFGRRKANLLSVATILASWVLIALSTGIPSLVFARCLQGLSIGLNTSLGPVLIGEYTSPKNRGAFLTTISLAISIGVLTVHTLGLLLSWQNTAVISSVISFVDMLIVIYSPESPSWLAEQGRFDECKRIFRWLRGNEEETELQTMIDAASVLQEAKADLNIPQNSLKRVKASTKLILSAITKKEFYKPIIIMIHLYMLGQWSGQNLLVAYIVDIFEIIVGNQVNIALMVIIVGLQRIVSNACAVYVIKKVKRRKMLFVTSGINMITLLTTAGYYYAKTRNMLPFDHPIIGILLIHAHMFTMATGTVPVPFIISGEIFPLEYRGLAGSISVFFLSFNLFGSLKTVPHLLSTIGLPGTYVLYVAIVGYCLLVTGLMLPETKDRTLQEIEEGFRGRRLTPEELQSTVSLTVRKSSSVDNCKSDIDKV